MMAADQAQAGSATGSPEERLAWRRITVSHGDRLAEIMDQFGWPTADVVGEEAAQAAWLVAQHADQQLEVQRRALKLLEAAVMDGQALARDLAFLRDRVAVNSGQEQIYGTQIAAVNSSGDPVPWPVVDLDLMDQRRVEVGIEPFEAHTARNRAAT